MILWGRYAKGVKKLLLARCAVNVILKKRFELISCISGSAFLFECNSLR